MFGSNIYTVGGNIPDDEYKKIAHVAGKIYELTRQLARSGRYDARLVRLLKPTNVVIILDTHSVHFVFTNKGVGGAPRVTHTDLRNEGENNLANAIALVEHELSYDECFGFSLPGNLLRQNVTDEELLPIIEGYYRSEALYQEKLARQVRITPIFKARDVLVEPNECFVLMPFGNEYSLQEIYRDQIVPTVEMAGLKCIRADDIYGPTPVIESIWECILRAGVILAELTGRNPNVFYELGVAHTVGKPVILITQNIDDVPFDLRHLRVILYEPTPRGAAGLQKQLQATLATIRTKQ